MRGYLGAAVVLALAAGPVFADNATPRSSSGSSASVGAHHHGSSGSSSTSSSSGSSSGSSHVSSGAERRHPRAGTGSGGRGYYYPHYGRHPYYGGYYPYYSYGGYPYFDVYWGSGYPYYGGYGYSSHYHSDGSVRVLVDPDQTRVYVDGYYAGVADDFDGLFQRLYVAPGRHEITLKLEGYRSHRMRVYVPYDGTLKIHYDMLKGSGDESFEDLAGPADRDEEPRYSRRDRGSRDEEAADDEAWRERDPDRRPERRPRSDAGAQLRLSVRPDDASVYVDGEFRGSGRQAGSLSVAPGRHRIEVVRPGFKTFDREVEVSADRPADVEVELERP